MSSINVLVLGHSHVYWLGVFARSASPSGLFANCGVLRDSCDVCYLGLQGVTVSLFWALVVQSPIALYGTDVVV